MDLVNGASPSEPQKGSDSNETQQANDLRPPANDAFDNDQGGSINILIQKEIIPRLLIVHSSQAKRPKFFEGRRVRAAEVDKFAVLPLELEADQLIAEVEKLRLDGVSTESILVDLLTASARRLGELWEDDSCDFIDVTVGLWRLHEVMRECSLNNMSQFDSLASEHSALFSPFPGDQHNFGTLIIEEVFANAGWQTEVLLEPQRHELIHLIAERPFDLVGLTVSCDCHSNAIHDLINSVRSVSKNSKVRIIIGGSRLIDDPSLALGVGADGTAKDARSALALAERMVAETIPITSPMP